MKQIFAALMIAMMAIPANAAPQAPAQPVAACQVQAPYGFPQSNKAGVPLCHHAYITFVDPAAKIPEWVVYTLTPEHALGCLPRTNAFAADASMPGSATPADYNNTGLDRGHMGPDGDMSFDDQAENESFFMTNMAPQAGSLNRGIWKLLETSIRGWSAQLNQTFTIMVGPIYNAQDPKIGSGVVVPHGFYKIVINDNTGEVAGWEFPHVKPYPNLGNDLSKFRMPIGQIQQLAGVRYSFPANAKEIGPGQEWPVDYGALTKAKRAKCGANAQD